LFMLTMLIYRMKISTPDAVSDVSREVGIEVSTEEM